MAFLAVGLSLRARAEEKPPRAVDKDLALDPSTACADYKVQGEYEGEIAATKTKLSAQVFALGGGTFHSVFLTGGLPGAGWDLSKRIESTGQWQADGKTDGDKTVIAPPEGKTGYSATISGETMSGKTDKGEAFELKKVMRQSPTMGAKCPDGGIVLFDGTALDKFEGGQIDDRKFLTTAHGNVVTKQKFGDYTLHVEFMEPFKPYGRDQDRGNSGVYQQNRYEVQVLDSFGLKGANNEAGGIYTKAAPKVNMALPPLSWQTYDIDFTAAKFEDGKKVKNAVVSVKHNGVPIHENQEINGPTGGGKPESAEGGPILLQGHGNPVFYRNIWIVEKK